MGRRDDTKKVLDISSYVAKKIEESENSKEISNLLIEMLIVEHEELYGELPFVPGFSVVRGESGADSAGDVTTT